MQGEYKLSDEQSPPTSNDLLGLHLRFDDVWFRAVYKCDHLVTFSLKGLAGRRIVGERTITPQSVRVEVSRRDSRNLRGRGLAQRLKWRVGIGAIDRIRGIAGIDAIDGIQRVVRSVLIDRIEDVVVRSYFSENPGSASTGAAKRKRSRSQTIHMASLRQAEQPVDSAYSPPGEQRKRVGKGFLHVIPASR